MNPYLDPKNLKFVEDTQKRIESALPRAIDMHERVEQTAEAREDLRKKYEYSKTDETSWGEALTGGISQGMQSTGEAVTGVVMSLYERATSDDSEMIEKHLVGDVADMGGWIDTIPMDTLRREYKEANSEDAMYRHLNASGMTNIGSKINFLGSFIGSMMDPANLLIMGGMGALKAPAGAVLKRMAARVGKAGFATKKMNKVAKFFTAKGMTTISDPLAAETLTKHLSAQIKNIPKAFASELAAEATIESVHYAEAFLGGKKAPELADVMMEVIAGAVGEMIFLDMLPTTVHYLTNKYTDLGNHLGFSTERVEDTMKHRRAMLKGAQDAYKTEAEGIISVMAGLEPRLKDDITRSINIKHPELDVKGRNKLINEEFEIAKKVQELHVMEQLVKEFEARDNDVLGTGIYADWVENIKPVEEIEAEVDVKEDPKTDVSETSAEDAELAPQMLTKRQEEARLTLKLAEIQKMINADKKELARVDSLAKIEKSQKAERVKEKKAQIAEIAAQVKADEKAAKVAEKEVQANLAAEKKKIAADLKSRKSEIAGLVALDKAEDKRVKALEKIETAQKKERAAEVKKAEAAAEKEHKEKVAAEEKKIADKLAKDKADIDRILKQESKEAKRVKRLDKIVKQQKAALAKKKALEVKAEKERKERIAKLDKAFDKKISKYASVMKNERAAEEKAAKKKLAKEKAERAAAIKKKVDALKKEIQSRLEAYAATAKENKIVNDKVRVDRKLEQQRAAEGLEAEVMALEEEERELVKEIMEAELEAEMEAELDEEITEEARREYEDLKRATTANLKFSEGLNAEAEAIAQRERDLDPTLETDAQQVEDLQEIETAANVRADVVRAHHNPEYDAQLHRDNLILNPMPDFNERITLKNMTVYVAVDADGKIQTSERKRMARGSYYTYSSPAKLLYDIDVKGLDLTIKKVTIEGNSQVLDSNYRFKKTYGKFSGGVKMLTDRFPKRDHSDEHSVNSDKRDSLKNWFKARIDQARASRQGSSLGTKGIDDVLMSKAMFDQTSGVTAVMHTVDANTAKRIPELDWHNHFDETTNDIHTYTPDLIEGYEFQRSSWGSDYNVTYEDVHQDTVDMEMVKDREGDRKKFASMEHQEKVNRAKPQEMESQTKEEAQEILRDEISRLMQEKKEVAPGGEETDTEDQDIFDTYQYILDNHQVVASYVDKTFRYFKQSNKPLIPYYEGKVDKLLKYVRYCR